MTSSISGTSLPPRLTTRPYRRIGRLTMLRAGVTSLTRRNKGAVPATFGRDCVVPELGVQSDSVEVRAREVLAYARVCGFASSVGVPPIYLHVLSLPLQMTLLLDRRFPWPLPGLVHLASSLRQLCPIEPGDRLNIAVWIDRLMSHPKGQAVVLACRAMRAAAVVWEGENVYLRRGVSSASGEAWKPAALLEHADLAPVETWCVPSDTGRRYARVSGDANPIHLHAWSARMFGFRRAIAHGMWTFARALAGLGRIPQSVYAHAEFRSPVLLPAQVCLRASPASVDGKRSGAWVVQSLDGSQVHAVGTCQELGGV